MADRKLEEHGTVELAMVLLATLKGKLSGIDHDSAVFVRNELQRRLDAWKPNKVKRFALIDCYVKTLVQQVVATFDQVEKTRIEGVPAISAALSAAEDPT